MIKKNAFILCICIFSSILILVGCDQPNTESIIDKNRSDIYVVFYGNTFPNDFHMGNIAVSYNGIDDANKGKKFKVIFFSDDYVNNELTDEEIQNFQKLMQEDFVVAYYCSSSEAIKSYAIKFGKTGNSNPNSKLRGLILFKDKYLCEIPSYVVASGLPDLKTDFNNFVSTTVFSTITEYKK